MWDIDPKRKCWRAYRHEGSNLYVAYVSRPWAKLGWRGPWSASGSVTLLDRLSRGRDGFLPRAEVYRNDVLVSDLHHFTEEMGKRRAMGIIELLVKNGRAESSKKAE